MTRAATPPPRFSKKLHNLVAFATSQGWTVCRTRNGHIRFSKGGYACIYTSSTASDYRSELNARALLRRAQKARNFGEAHALDH